MTSKGTPRRSIRIEDRLWEAASRAAVSHGTDISTVIREMLIDYTACTMLSADELAAFQARALRA